LTRSRNPKNVSNLSEKWSETLIPDPDFFSIPDPGVKKHRIPDPDTQHWKVQTKYNKI
jgi:hypothetical protein